MTCFLVRNVKNYDIIELRKINYYHMYMKTKLVIILLVLLATSNMLAQGGNTIEQEVSF
jgi:hypothetical protein